MIGACGKMAGQSEGRRSGQCDRHRFGRRRAPWGAAEAAPAAAVARASTDRRRAMRPRPEIAHGPNCPTCGLAGLPCCPGSSCADPSLACESGRYVCAPCGGPGQACCNNQPSCVAPYTCNVGAYYRCECTGTGCGACGTPGHLCCPTAPACSSGASWGTTDGSMSASPAAVRGRRVAPETRAPEAVVVSSAAAWPTATPAGSRAADSGSVPGAHAAAGSSVSGVARGRTRTAPTAWGSVPSRTRSAKAAIPRTRASTVAMPVSRVAWAACAPAPTSAIRSIS